MKIKRYIAALQRLAEKYPNAEVIYADDDEGNHFAPVSMLPSIGAWYGDGEDFDTESDEKNAICLN